MKNLSDRIDSENRQGQVNGTDEWNQWKEAAKQEIAAHYREDFDRAFKKLTEEPGKDRICCVGPSGYLFSLGGVRFGMDLQISNPWTYPAVSDQLTKALDSLDFLLISHAHKDHYDPTVIRHLKDTSARLLIPSFFNREKLMKKTGFPEDRIVCLSEGEPFTERSLCIRPFRSLHTDPDGGHAVDEFGYLMEDGTHTLFHPVDVRNYLPSYFPAVDSPDLMIMHIWLGRKNARNFPCEPYLTDFCRFAAHYHPKRLLLGHLYEFAREMDSLWTDEHAGLVLEKLRELLPGTEIRIAKIGESFDCFEPIH